MREFAGVELLAIQMRNFPLISRAVFRFTIGGFLIASLQHGLPV
jgi:hypothetical protein